MSHLPLVRNISSNGVMLAGSGFLSPRNQTIGLAVSAVEKIFVITEWQRRHGSQWFW
jgi:hypothetical protein